MSISIELPSTAPSYVEDTPMGVARRSQCIRDMAGMLVLIQTGTEWDENDGENGDVVGELCEKVAILRDELHLSPDAIQEVLEFHERTLAAGDGNWPDLLHGRAQQSQNLMGSDAHILASRELTYRSDERYPKITRRIGHIAARAVSSWVERFHLSGTRK